MDNANINSLQLKQFFFFAVLGLASAVAVYLFQPVLIPLILSFALYSVLEPITNAFVRYGLPRLLAISLALISMTSVSVLLLVILLPILFEQIAQLQTQLPNIYKGFHEFIAEIQVWVKSHSGINIDPSLISEPLLEVSQTWTQDTFIQISGMVVSTIIVLILVPLISFFLLKDYRILRNRLMHWLPNNSFELGWLIYARVSNRLQKYIRGILIQSSIMAANATIGFYLIGLEMAILMGILTGLFNIIPYVGPIMAMAVAVIIALTHIPLDMNLVLAAVLVVLVAQLIDNVFVVPSVIAGVVGLHPLTVIIGIIVFGDLFGFLGMVLAIPALSTAKILFTGLQYGLRGEPEINGNRINQPIC